MDVDAIEAEMENLVSTPWVVEIAPPGSVWVDRFVLRNPETFIARFAVRAEAEFCAAAPYRLEALIARVRELEAELREIQRISAPGRAWPYERVTALLDKEP